MPGLSEFSICKVASVLSKPGGMTLNEVTTALSVSRPTALRWLTLMEGGGLVYRSYRMNGSKGRPSGVYHPSLGLRNKMTNQEGGTLAILSFAALKGVCRYKEEGKCAKRESAPCGVLACPLLRE